MNDIEDDISVEADKTVSVSINIDHILKRRIDVVKRAINIALDRFNDNDNPSLINTGIVDNRLVLVFESDIK